MSASDVVILCGGTPTEADHRAHRIASFLGADATLVTLDLAALAAGPADRKIAPSCGCLLIDAKTLAAAADAVPSGARRLRDAICEVASHVCVFGFQAADNHRGILRDWSEGGLTDVQPLSGNASFHFTTSFREGCGQLSGLSLGTAGLQNESSFVEGVGAKRADVIIRLGRAPFLARTEYRGTKLFFLAARELADLDERVGRQSPPFAWFSGLIPLMMVLRGALGDRVWHNDSPKACLIIDDPLLKKRHGFLKYQQLIGSMRRGRFFTCIAFIPWNFRRSTPDVAALFSSEDRSLGLCVHGCDHTHGEFAATDVDGLQGKARLALERMRAHRDLSGAPFDDVMVFPQGLFSAEAISAVKAAGYLAAVNSTVHPSTGPHELTLRTMLDAAVTSFDNFPLFSRRYPRDLAEFALDLFLGKPALIVEHHGYFRHGYAAIEAFVEDLNSVDRRLEWASLGTICSSACLTRTTEDGEIHVRFYTRRFRLTNSDTKPHRYALFQARASDDSAPVVTVDGNPRPVEADEHGLTLRVSLGSGQTVDIQSASPSANVLGPGVRQTKAQRVKTGLRRLFSEFRDNHVHTNRALSAIAAFFIGTPV